jgi:cardiolipin synthase
MTAVRYLPNALTFFRLFLSAPLAVWIWEGQLGQTLVLLLTAALTDLLDGFLARHWNARSALGSWLDPAADKTMITTVLVTLTVRGDLPGWFCLLTVARDLGLVTGVLILLGRGVDVKIRPLLTGKLATGAQNGALLLAILHRVDVLDRTLHWFLPVSASLTVISFGAYFRVYLRLYKKTGAGSPRLS